MEFIAKNINDYCENHSMPESELLSELNRETHSKILQARMLSGHLQGRILSMFSHMIQPKRILEIGTYTGYSALCLAEGLTADGKLITIDVNEELEAFTRSFFNKSEFGAKIEYIIGNALEIIPNLDEKFDIVFIDADKMNYTNYYNMVFPMLSIGGYIISDNVLWSGKVVELGTKRDKETIEIMNFNDMCQNDVRTENILFPIRDGLMVSRKISE